jgi:hypothetical protein
MYKHKVAVPVNEVTEQEAETENGRGLVPDFDYPGLMVKVLEIPDYAFSSS